MMLKCPQVPRKTQISPEHFAKLLKRYDENRDGKIDVNDAVLLDRKGWRAAYKSKEREDYFQRHSEIYEVIRALYLGTRSPKNTRDSYNTYRK